MGTYVGFYLDQNYGGMSLRATAALVPEGRPRFTASSDRCMRHFTLVDLTQLNASGCQPPRPYLESVIRAAFTGSWRETLLLIEPVE